MADVARDHTKMDFFPYEVKWKTELLGYCKDVDPTGLKPKRMDKKIGELSDVVIDRVHVGGVEDNATVKMTLHQVQKAIVQKLCPWWTTGSVPLIPAAQYFSEYGNAGLLTIHPIGVSGTDEDINIVKAFPLFSLPKSDGKTWREIVVDWHIYLDLAELPDRITHYYGAVPA